MTDKWGRAYPHMPDPHKHYPRGYSPAGFGPERVAWREEHDRWVAEQMQEQFGTPQERLAIGPGDTLIVRISMDRWSFDQADQYEQYLNERLGVPVKLVAGEELAVVRSEVSLECACVKATMLNEKPYDARLADARALQAALAAELDGLSEADAASVMAPFMESERSRV